MFTTEDHSSMPNVEKLYNRDDPLSSVRFTRAVPEIWLKSLVCPIFNKGAKSDLYNYRPFSLTCVVGEGDGEHPGGRHDLSHGGKQTAQTQSTWISTWEINFDLYAGIPGDTHPVVR